jgi:Dolichyl-phosphate-mannose-protein mannosyltransferase
LITARADKFNVSDCLTLHRGFYSILMLDVAPLKRSAARSIPLEASDVISDTQVQTSGARPLRSDGFRPAQDRVPYALYGLALALSISTWFIAIRAPLWLDETISWFMIKGGFLEILSRQGWPGVPAYPVVLWLWTKAMGTAELTLRMSSVLSMLGAVYLLYLSARELFDWDVAVIAAVFFCLHPVVNVESIDVRPYAFAALAITSSIFILVRLRRNNSNWLAAVFGLSAACIAYFQFLFVVILPALLIGFVAVKIRDRNTLWRQLGVAMVVFALAFLPVIPGLQYMFHTSGIHVFDVAPRLGDLGQVLGQKRPALILAAIFIIAAATRRLHLHRQVDVRLIFLCASLALVPILLLYGISAETSVHIFVFRYRLVAVPGVALCSAFAVSRINSRGLRLLFCLAFVAAAGYHYFSTRASRVDNYTWKYALAFVENNASADDAPVLICSDLPESNYMLMPAGSAAKDSAIFAPLSYYKLSVPVVALPRALNQEAVRIGSQFLEQAAQRHERFLALAYTPSYPTLAWLASNSAATHYVRRLGDFNGIKVVEFVPRALADNSQ